MSTKGMLQLLTPFAVGVLVFVVFYLLGSLSWILEAIFEFLDDIGIDNRIDRFFRDLYDDFFFIVNNGNIAGRVVAIVLWIIGTIITELWITTEDMD